MTDDRFNELLDGGKAVSVTDALNAFVARGQAAQRAVDADAPAEAGTPNLFAVNPNERNNDQTKAEDLSSSAAARTVPSTPARAAAESNADGGVRSAESASRNRSLNPTRFICRAEVRKFLLEFAGANRAHKFSRVSEEALVEVNNAVRSLLISQGAAAAIERENDMRTGSFLQEIAESAEGGQR